ncbi:MAG: YggS family pyridoxal phosphate-dependent enzyme [Pseudomonadales bacterium]|jgi:pyridoxal phosphate enzyme (YggS family)|nr:YggS family pyridoxal phosphate-dependent enzyme [Pseudomonadales bacterium]
MNTAIAQRLALLHQRIAAAEAEAGRPPGSVQLLAVSKTQNAARVREALAAGQRVFAENYVQEALDKMAALHEAGVLSWHFIGPIQSNKTRPLAEHFDWIHSIDRLKIAQRLNDQRPTERPPLNVLIEVNVSGEDSKAGAAPADVPALAAAIAALPRLCLRGLMCIPAPASGLDQQRLPFRQLRELRDALLASGHATCTELSMGMSADFPAAILEGATLIRVGTDVFGPRQ